MALMSTNLHAHRVTAHPATLGSVTAFCAGGLVAVGAGGRKVGERGATG